MKLQPTHRCFDDALDFLEAIALTEGRDELNAHVLVHGICLAPTDGHRYAHAWVERGDEVFHSCLLDGELVYAVVSRAEYYAESRVQETTRYTPREAWAENCRSGHYGPWVPRYRDLCR